MTRRRLPQSRLPWLLQTVTTGVVLSAPSRLPRLPLPTRRQKSLFFFFPFFFFYPFLPNRHPSHSEKTPPRQPLHSDFTAGLFSPLSRVILLSLFLCHPSKPNLSPPNCYNNNNNNSNICSAGFLNRSEGIIQKKKDRKKKKMKKNEKHNFADLFAVAFQFIFSSSVLS